MVTKLTKYTDAYATVTVATYEPLVLRWISTWGLGVIATDLANRAPKAALMKRDGLPTAVRLDLSRPRPADPIPDEALAPLAVERPIADLEGRPFPAGIERPVTVRDRPDAVAVGADVYPLGVARLIGQSAAQLHRGVVGWLRGLAGGAAARSLAGVSLPRTIPVGVNPSLGSAPADFDLHTARRGVLASLTAEVDRALADHPAGVGLGIDIDAAVQASSYSFAPVSVEEALSPIGVAHFYRNLFFNLEEGIGPIEQAFTIAPLETLEVVYETSRREIYEELVEQGSEIVSELAIEERNVDEVSDKLSSMIQRDSSASMSVSGGGGVVGVWNVSGEASADLSTSSQRSREETSRRVTEMTTRSSERITKSFTVKTREVDEISTTNLTRRVISNDGADPVSYGLRRVLRKVRVKVQDIGPSLVWQIYICEPGSGLATSKLVHFREPSDIANPDVPPGAPPRPVGDTDTGSGSSNVEWNAQRNTSFVTVQVAPGPGRVVTAVILDSITDLEGGGKDDLAPSPRPEIPPFDAVVDPNTGNSTTQRDATGGGGEEVEELDRLSRVFVMLPSQLDASNFGELFLAGLKADRSPWGLGWASEYGFDVQYSSATVPRGVLGFVQRAVRAVVGVDLVHGWANRRAINDADLILTHMEREWVSAAFTLKSKRPNGPKLVANTIWLPGEWARRNGFWRWAVNRARRKVDYFTFNAKPALEAFAQLFGEDTPLHYVVFGTSWESFIPATRTPDPDRCVLVAGDDPYRDWSLLESVASRLPEVQFVVASKSSPPSLAGLGNVEIQIASGPREMQRLYERCAVSFIPSRPNLHASGITVALETARVGRPIVITDTGGIADYFSPDEVAFFEVGDVADASRRIRELLANPDHSRILSSAATARITRSRNDSRSFAERLLKAVGALD